MDYAQRMLNKQSICGVPDCGRTVHSRGVCAMHYSTAIRGTASPQKVKEARHYMKKSRRKGNAAGVQADGEQVVQSYLARKMTVRGLCKKYHVGYVTLMHVLLARTTFAQRQALKHRRHVAHARRYGFQPGHVPAHRPPKGVRFSPATEFKPGCIRGAAARKWRPVGTITLRHDKPPKRLRGRKRMEGMPPWRGKPRWWIKVRDDGLPWHRWIPLARHLWREAHGPIPAGKFVVHADGNTLNDSLANLLLVDHAQHLRLQMHRNPQHEVNLRRAASATTTQRHAANRGLKKLCGPITIQWECGCCGYGARQRIEPERCPKCGGSAFERLRMRAAG